MSQNLNIRKLSQPLTVVCLSLLALSLGACSFFRSSPPSREEQAEKLQEAMGKGGYAPASGFAIGSNHDVWLHDKTELEVAITAPTAQGVYPLIIYLPGLGEDAEAGRLWREAWAKAGYAVFSMQPKTISLALNELGSWRGDESGGGADDELRGLPDQDGMRSPEEDNAWFGDKRRRPSRTARNSELHYLGHEYFATENLKNRMQQLLWAYRQLKTRVDLRQPLFASADLSRVILAGYDLGAQTVSAVLGENFETDLPSSDELKPMAAILLSPSVSLAEGNVRGRFQRLKTPMLVITGSDDDDPYAVSSASVRSAVWEYAPSGGKYLLSMKGARHSVFAGSEMSGRMGLDRRGEFEGATEDMGGRNARGGRGGDGALPGGMMKVFPIESERRDANLGYKQVAAILSASTAFLDSGVKNDPMARFWMDDKANTWLGSVGSLQGR